MSDGEALFEPLGGGRFLPGPHTRGPWDPRAQHGGAPAALIAGEIERVEPGADMRVARVTFEFVRPVPLSELRVDTELVRPGRRVQLVAARMWSGDTLVASALALRIRRAAGVAPEVTGDAVAPPLEGARPQTLVHEPPGAAFATTAVDIRFAHGGYAEPGPAFAWLRLRSAVVSGAAPTPLQRASAAADFGNGLSAALDWGSHVFVNPDLTVHLARDPIGEWIGLDAATTIAQDGTGQAVSVLHDEAGELGRAVQSLYVDTR